MITSSHLLLLAFLAGALTACISVPSTPGQIIGPGAASFAGPGVGTTDTPEAAAPSPTATIVWFPPTPTPSPFPTQELLPTQDMRPDQGELIFSDDFSTADLWGLSTSAEGRVALSKNELTVAIAPTPSKDYFYSLRSEPVLTDFYAEITASTSLCKGSDEYGVLVRAASPQDYYRFTITCSGQSRVERIIAGHTTAPQPWILSGSIPPGAPGIVRLGVWAAGKEIRFFANDEHLFTINDPLIPSGAVGIFARSVSDNAVTVNFSNLVVRSISR